MNAKQELFKRPGDILMKKEEAVKTSMQCEKMKYSHAVSWKLAI